MPPALRSRVGFTNLTSHAEMRTGTCVAAVLASGCPSAGCISGSCVVALVSFRFYCSESSHLGGDWGYQRKTRVGRIHLGQASSSSLMGCWVLVIVVSFVSCALRHLHAWLGAPFRTSSGGCTACCRMSLRCFLLIFPSDFVFQRRWRCSASDTRECACSVGVGRPFPVGVHRTSDTGVHASRAFRECGVTLSSGIRRPCRD